MKRIYAFDIDGTLVEYPHKIRPAVIEALNELGKNSDNYIVFCSGRNLSGVKVYADQFDIKNVFYSASNGASIYDKDCNLLKETALTFKDFMYIRSTFVEKDEELFIYAYLKDKILYDEFHEIIPFEEKSLNCVAEKLDLNSPDELKLDKIMVQSKSLSHYEQSIFPQDLLDKYSCVVSTKIFLEFTNKLVDKGEAILFLSKLLNVDNKDIYVFGDSGNDITMFRVVENSIAMGNATPEIKDAAKYVTKHVNKDGVVYALKSILKAI